MSGAFVLSVGRSGSTLLTRMMQQHKKICSISEYWTCLFMRSIGDPNLSGRAYWAMLSEAPHWYTNFVDKAQAAHQLPSEFVYDENNGRYAIRDCPPLLTMTLPALTDRPESLFDSLADVVPLWPRRNVTAHSKSLFDLMCRKVDRHLWIERSGLSYWYVPDLVKGFPDAKYVHLVRDGREVLLSMMGMRLFDPIVRATWMLSAVAGPAMQRELYFNWRGLSRRLMLNAVDVERTLTGQHGRARPYSLPDHLSQAERTRAYATFWALTASLGQEAIAAIPADRVHTVRYEALVERPREVLEAMMAFLLPGEDHGGWIDAVVHMPSPRPGRWSTVDPALAAEVEAIIGPANRALGYD